jgi:hypothetical protein
VGGQQHRQADRVAEAQPGRVEHEVNVAAVEGVVEDRPQHRRAVHVEFAVDLHDGRRGTCTLRNLDRHAYTSAPGMNRITDLRKRVSPGPPVREAYAAADIRQ